MFKTLRENYKNSPWQQKQCKMILVFFVAIISEVVFVLALAGSFFVVAAVALASFIFFAKRVYREL